MARLGISETTFMRRKLKLCVDTVGMIHARRFCWEEARAGFYRRKRTLIAEVRQFIWTTGLDDVARMRCKHARANQHIQQNITI